MSNQTRFNVGDTAVIRAGMELSGYWDSDFDRLVGRQVKITHVYNDSEGYFYGIEESPFVVDSVLLTPINAFELAPDEEIDDIDTSHFAEGFEVEV